MVTVAVPFAFAAGVNVSTPLAETLGCALKSALLSLEVKNVSVWPLSFGPALMPVAHAAEYAPESSLTVTLPPLVKDGSSFTALTVMTNVTGSEVLSFGETFEPLSDSVTVTVALPKAFVAGVKVRLPLGLMA